MDIPTDALVEILVRLPLIARLEARLVCRLWREVVTQRTWTDMRRLGNILAVDSEGLAHFAGHGRMSIVGTCNHIVCLCYDGDWGAGYPGGDVQLVNPATDYGFGLPELPLSDTAVMRKPGGWRWHETYVFARHPTTRQYKIVHVPCHLDRFCNPGMVQVFTLGEASWREVHAGPDSRRAPGACRLTDVDGTVYWVTKGRRKIMSLDLGDVRVKPVEPLPVPVKPARCRRRQRRRGDGMGPCLTNVHGRLGAAVEDDDDESVTVWALQGERWSRRYVVKAHRLAMPYFAHGDCVLTLGSAGKKFAVYWHNVSEAERSQGSVVQIRDKDRHNGEVLSSSYRIDRTFSYVRTTARPWSVTDRESAGVS
ncbi:uncharacterized protein [Aegilops tauschii subsp. strangulata]|uniref:uncharacterized protein n=1 Tax=Aegilops tauschii subsp. strangulata TaxID=200361 RepID=UPI00098B6EEA|nr:uncharacterized protein LOC109747006 [Aegilops tauschii subsp. strangulata]